MPRQSMTRKGPSARMIRRILKGHKFSPSADPPTTIINPWFPMVCTFDMVFPITPPQQDINAGVYRMHGADIKSQIGTQLGIDLTKVNLLLKIRSIAVWKLTPGPLGLMPSDPFDADDSNCLAQIEDSPGKATWARAGFVYPEFISDRPWFVKSDSSSGCCQIIVASATDKAEVLVHLSISFKFDTAAWPEFMARARQALKPQPPTTSSIESEIDLGFENLKI